MLRKLFGKYSEKSRIRKCELFFELMKTSPNDILLDARGGLGVGFHDIWDFFEETIIVDLNKYALDIVNEKFDNIKTVVGMHVVYQ